MGGARDASTDYNNSHTMSKSQHQVAIIGLAKPQSQQSLEGVFPSAKQTPALEKTVPVDSPTVTSLSADGLCRSRITSDLCGEIYFFSNLE